MQFSVQTIFSPQSCYPTVTLPQRHRQKQAQEQDVLVYSTSYHMLQTSSRHTNTVCIHDSAVILLSRTSITVFEASHRQTSIRSRAHFIDTYMPDMSTKFV